MGEYQIKASAEKGQQKAQFTVNKNIGPKNPMHFKNIDEAKGHP